MRTIDALWQQLFRTRHLVIETSSQARGQATVLVSAPTKTTLLFTEKGEWSHLTEPVAFHNTLRWSLDASFERISLEHLRYGQDQPVFLFYLAPTGQTSLQSIDPHLCRDDRYFGRIEFNRSDIQFLWHIIGPKKNEILYHTYT
jgi:hypothetical protein